MPSPLDHLTPLDTLSLASRRVLVRVDFDVPLERDGAVRDDARVREALPTLQHLIAQGARVVVASHLGRPRKGYNAAQSLAAPGERLAELLSMDIALTDECVGDGARKVVNDLRDGRVALLENLRFHPGEESGDDGFAGELSRLCDVYVNDDFRHAHLPWASVAALPRLLPLRAPGLRMMKELKALTSLASPARPFVAALGGDSLSARAPLLEALMGRVDAVLVGGVAGNTLLAALGRDMGRSRVESDKLPLARAILERAQSRRVALLLPTDVVVAPSMESPAGSVVAVTDVGAGRMVLDVGPATLAAWRERLLGAKTVLWWGPAGSDERTTWGAGSHSLGRAIVEAAGFSVVVGDATAAVARAAGVADRLSHVSSGAASAVALLEGRKLPGVEALRT